MVVVRARVHRNERFHRSLGFQATVRHRLRQVVAFPSPVLDMYPRLLPLLQFRAERFLKIIREFSRIGPFHVTFEDGGIPNSWRLGEKESWVWCGRRRR